MLLFIFVAILYQSNIQLVVVLGDEVNIVGGPGVDTGVAGLSASITPGDNTTKGAAITITGHGSTGVALFADGPALAQLWMFWVAPLIGGAVGALIWRVTSSED